MKYVASIAAATLIAVPALAADGDKDWNFGDGVTAERWSLVNGDYAMCDAGLNQSPIDLGNPNAFGSVDIETKYGATTAKLAIAEEKAQLDFSAGMGMMSGGMQFNLLQVHFHTPSEHAINGKRYPLVGHFVHATEDGKLGVLGIMFEEGAANAGLAAMIAATAQGSGADVAVDVTDMIPENPSVYRYMGSLTTPPCSEGVNWHVSKEVMTASAEQIAALNALLGPSARSLQPQGNRLVVAPGE